MPSIVLESPPPLKDGDLLDQPEFHRRYAAMPETFWAELIDGKVYVMSPAYGPHSDLHAIVDGWLFHYMLKTPGVRVRSSPSTILGPRNEPQPDAVLFIKPEYGGRIHFDEHGCSVGAPELVVEVSVSSESRDLRLKLREYEKAGVNEYVVLLPRRKTVRWFELESKRFVEVKSEAGIFRSHQFPGLWLDTRALLSEDASKLIEVLDRGLTDPAHEAFLKKLESQKAKQSRRK